MFKKILIATTALTLLAGSAVGQQAKVLKYTHYQPGREDQPKHAAALAFEACVEKATSGSIDVQIFPAGQLGNATTALEGLKFGTLELAVVHDGGISSVYQPFDVFALPYLFPNHETAYKVLDGEFGKEFADEMLKETGIRLLAYADNGIRHFTNSKHPIKTPADMQGLKMRVQPAPVFISLMESLGASPSAIDWAELPAALAQGTVDGQENGVTNIMAASLYQSQKYVTLDGHVYSLHAYLMSDAFYQGLSDTEKQAVETCVVEARTIHRDMTRATDLAAEKTLTDVGMEVYVPTEEEIAAFRELAQPAVRKHLEEAVGAERVEKLLQAEAEAAGSQ
ncbi:tripartite ATP-independent transporter DctP family solute receptor [Pseudorhizobium tarimense]|uniref:Tripartite ATP-independent transporter DctP family solute receptor n=1 Tax=Pseudorhizobium tarimense TaxID=1079109 RepID=A0ABV2HBJ3_9HYPH|nr:DctP family TRAP transporter solute-binding subunit [Pseudorhizobium tarimense]MCJ8520934.1 DctP family TRAP transporter solute-binding subunit [Pseudorhizobium tarimense]